jgi:hypothetical protein
MLLVVSSQKGKSSALAPAFSRLRIQRPGHVVPFRQRGVFGKLLVPPVHLLLVQAAAEFAAGAQQALLVGKLVAQAMLFHGRRQVPLRRDIGTV